MKKMIVRILKYIIVAAIIAYVAMLLITTGGSSKPFEEVSKGVEKAVDADTLTKMNTQALRRFYGLNGANYQGVTLYTATSSMSAEELLVVETKSMEQVDEVREAIEKRISARKSDFDGYAPDEVTLANGAIIEVRGKYVFFTISKNAEKYKKAFIDSL